MNDLVKRLREEAALKWSSEIAYEAADHIESQASVIATLENRLNLLAVDRGRLERLEAFVERVRAIQKLRWVERGQPNGPQAQSVRVLQYREPKGAPYIEDGYKIQDWSKWRDVPTEAE